MSKKNYRFHLDTLPFEDESCRLAILDDTLAVTIKKDVQLELDITKGLNIHYELWPSSRLVLWEKRNIPQGGKLSREVTMGENSDMTAMFFHEGTHRDMVYSDTMNMARDANLLVSYGELSDGNTDGQVVINLNGGGARSHLYMAAVSDQEQKKHYQLTINHHQPHTYGLMENAGVVRQRGALIFDGVGRIQKGCSQAQSHQTSRIIVFDKECLAKANPYLYIDDYDVAASHAAAVGAVNEEHLYYLESRGLTRSQATRLITTGYLMPAVKAISFPGLEEYFQAFLAKKVGDL